MRIRKEEFLLPFLLAEFEPFGRDSIKTRMISSYCRLKCADLELTVVRQGMIFFTAVSEYFPAQIAVVGAGFAGCYCHQAMKKIKITVLLKTFALSTVISEKSTFKTAVREGAFEYNTVFFVALAVVNPLSKNRTVALIFDRQYI